jgi:hypothetical protein
MIYLIQYAFPGSPTKIGYSANQTTLRTRMRAFGTASAWTLEVLSVHEGYKLDEYALHTEFAPFRMNGEWFRTEKPVQDFIAVAADPQTRDLRAEARKIMDLYYQERRVRVV